MDETQEVKNLKKTIIILVIGIIVLAISQFFWLFESINNRNIANSYCELGNDQVDLLNLRAQQIDYINEALGLNKTIELFQKRECIEKIEIWK